MTTDEPARRPDPDDLPPEHDLDVELRRLFADDRLDLPVHRHASAAVVAGARRRRRRRMAVATAGGVAAVAAVVFAAAILSGLVHPVGRVAAAAPSSGPVLSTTIATTTTISPAPSEKTLVLGPDGYGDLRLGMSWKNALASGELQKAAGVDPAGCVRYVVLFDGSGALPTTPARVPRSTGGAPGATPALSVAAELVVSVRDGVVQVIAGPLLRTPEGIGIGSPRDILLDAYPKLVVPPRGGSAVTTVVANPDAVYVFDVDGTGVVTSFSLRMAKSDCLG